MALAPHHSPRRRVAILATALAVLACGAAATSSPAHAGCGDYVLVGDEAHHLARMAEHAEWPATAHRSAPEPRPCSGPTCSRQPAAPAPAVPGERLLTAEQQAAALFGGSTADRPLAALPWPHSSERPPAEFFDRLFRPPR